jgi:pimeloyl-ACP methyl ester carboxylesterase
MKAQQPNARPWPLIRRLMLSLVALAILPAACSSRRGTPASVNSPGAETLAEVPYRFEPARCQFLIPPGQTVTCGYLFVPEDRSQVDSPTIRLHVAVIKSRADHPAPDPLLFLAGGPGGHALDAIEWTARNFNNVLQKRDLILFDQRGVGHSQPSLDCPEVTDLLSEILEQNLSREEGARRNVAANLACRDHLVKEGINLAAYNSAASAADVNDLRLALGYDKWNLYGVSYGTRLALTVMRDFPQGIRSVILDSVYPPQVDLGAERAVNAERAFNLLFERCAADAACNAAFPDLESAFYDLIAGLDAEPIQVPVRSYNASLNGDDLIGVLFRLLYDSDAIPGLPKLIFDVRRGSYSGLRRWLPRVIFQSEFISEGMHNSVQCGEEVRFSSPDAIAASSASMRPRIRVFLDVYANAEFSICEAWGAKEAGPIENEPVISDIPTLVLAGDYDPVTPPAWGQMAVATLNNAHYLEFPGVGHGVLMARRCARDIVSGFLDTPTTAPHSSCIAELRVGFITR